jgi:hypothetical protein
MKSKQNLAINSRFKGLLMASFGFFMLFFAAAFLLQKIENREIIAKFLPAEQSIGLIEINFDPDKPANQLLISRYAPELESLKSILPSSEYLQKMWGGKAAFALLKNQNGQSVIPVFFLKFNDYSRFQDWLISLQIDGQSDNLIEDNFYGQKVLSFRKGQQFNLLITGNYLVIAEQKSTLELIAKTTAGLTDSLYQTSQYNQVYSSLPQQNLLFAYLDSDKLLQVANKSPGFLEQRLSQFQLFYPFLKMFSAESIAVNAELKEQKLQIVAQQLSSFNQAELPSADFFQTEYFYAGKLDQFLPDSPQTVFSFRGVNLLDQKNKLEAYFRDKSDLEKLVFSGSLEKIRQDFLSNNLTSRDQIDLDRDFFPLFQDEYLFFISKDSQNNPDYSLVLYSSQPENALLKFKKVLGQLSIKLLAEESVRTVEKTLPDGTKSSEVVSDISPDSNSDQSSSAGNPVEIINLGSLKVYLQAYGNYLLASTSNQQIQSHILAIQNGLQDIKSPPLKFTEIWQTDLTWLKDTFKLPSIAGFEKLSGTRKFTEIGILSTYQLY